MYDELVKRLRDSEHEIDCSLCDRDCCYQDGKVHGKCIIIEAADAIETLYTAYTESFSVIAKAFRNNPKNLVLKEYMMKNACCCETEEGE